MVYRLKRILIWLSRCAESRGFGVQSPSAYEFIRYVVNEHYPYYAYDDLQKKYPDVEGQNRRIAKLYFRIANFIQPEYWYLYLPFSDVYRFYINAGCRKTKVVDYSESVGSFNVSVVSLRDAFRIVINHLIDIASEKSVLIIEGIHINRDNFKYWNTVLKNNKISVSFDVYYCGIIFFDNRFRCNYKVNF